MMELDNFLSSSQTFKNQEPATFRVNSADRGRITNRSHTLLSAQNTSGNLETYRKERTQVNFADQDRDSGTPNRASADISPTQKKITLSGSPVAHANKLPVPTHLLDFSVASQSHNLPSPNHIYLIKTSQSSAVSPQALGQGFSPRLNQTGFPQLTQSQRFYLGMEAVSQVNGGNGSQRNFVYKRHMKSRKVCLQVQQSNIQGEIDKFSQDLKLTKYLQPIKSHFRIAHQDNTKHMEESKNLKQSLFSQEDKSQSQKQRGLKQIFSEPRSPKEKDHHHNFQNIKNIKGGQAIIKQNQRQTSSDEVETSERIATRRTNAQLYRQDQKFKQTKSIQENQGFVQIDDEVNKEGGREQINELILTNKNRNKSMKSSTFFSHMLRGHKGKRQQIFAQQLQQIQQSDIDGVFRNHNHQLPKKISLRNSGVALAEVLNSSRRQNIAGDLTQEQSLPNEEGPLNFDDQNQRRETTSEDEQSAPRLHLAHSSHQQKRVQIAEQQQFLISKGPRASAPLFIDSLSSSGQYSPLKAKGLRDLRDQMSQLANQSSPKKRNSKHSPIKGSQLSQINSETQMTPSKRIQEEDQAEQGEVGLEIGVGDPLNSPKSKKLKVITQVIQQSKYNSASGLGSQKFKQRNVGSHLKIRMNSQSGLEKNQDIAKKILLNQILIHDHYQKIQDQARYPRVQYNSSKRLKDANQPINSPFGYNLNRTTNEQIGIGGRLPYMKYQIDFSDKLGQSSGGIVSEHQTHVSMNPNLSSEAFTPILRQPHLFKKTTSDYNQLQISSKLAYQTSQNKYAEQRIQKSVLMDLLQSSGNPTTSNRKVQKQLDFDQIQKTTAKQDLSSNLSDGNQEAILSPFARFVKGQSEMRESKGLLRRSRREKNNFDREKLFAIAVPGYVEYVYNL